MGDCIGQKYLRIEDITAENSCDLASSSVLPGRGSALIVMELTASDYYFDFFWTSIGH